MVNKEYATLNILLKIINRFYQGEKLSIEIIADSYDLSVKTSQRYIHYLKNAGFNIQKDGDFYILMD